MIYRDYDIRIHPNLTDWVIRHHGVVVHFAPTQATAIAWIDQRAWEAIGRLHASSEGRAWGGGIKMFADLNALRVAKNMKPLASWKKSKVKLAKELAIMGGNIEGSKSLEKISAAD